MDSRQRRTGIVCGAVVVTLALMGTGPAAATCAPNRPSGNFLNRFAGGSNTATGADDKTEARATIPYYTPFVDASQPDAGSFAWPMIAQPTCGQRNGFAQVGEGEWFG